MTNLARARLRLTGDWDPRSLPKVAIRDHQISRLRTLCDLVFQMAALVWFLLLPSAPVLILGPAAAFVEFSPPARMAYVPLLLVILATVALHVVDFARPYWTRSRALMRLSVGFMSLLVFAFLALADHFVSAAAVAPTFDPAATERVVGVIDASFRIGFGVAAIMATVEIVKILRRLKDLSSPPASSDSAPARAGR